MSGKLDQSLDQIMQDSGSTGRRRGPGGRPRTNRRAAQKAKAAIAAPAGGVQKNIKGAKTTAKAPAMAAPKGPAARGESKIIISNLPADVDEAQVKEFLQRSKLPSKRVMGTYGPDGRNRGIFTVIFGDATYGARAVKEFNGVPVDGARKMRVELVVGANDAPAPALPKGLADRIAKPKSAAKEAKAAPKGKGAATANANGAAEGKGGRGKKSARAGRPKKKTADELDAEMMDYFGNENGGAANGAAEPAAVTNGAEPVDEVM